MRDISCLSSLVQLAELYLAFHPDINLDVPKHFQRLKILSIRRDDKPFFNQQEGHDFSCIFQLYHLKELELDKVAELGISTLTRGCMSILSRDLLYDIRYS